MACMHACSATNLIGSAEMCYSCLSTGPCAPPRPLQVFNSERFIQGSEIVKWNGNYSNVNMERTAEAVQAFSHWTWHVSNGELQVVDIQGVWDPAKEQYLLFDPAIHTRSLASRLRFGRTNLGTSGMQQFFSTHVCSLLCQHLKLKRHPTQPSLPQA